MSEKCTKLVGVITDVKLIAEPPNRIFGWGHKTLQEKNRILRDWVKEFHEFIRDHRSQDPVSLDVETVKKDICSACESEWETDEYEGKTICASCGAEVSEVKPENVKE